MRPVPALVAACLLVPGSALGCAAGPAGPAPATPQASVEPTDAEAVSDPGAPVADLHLDCTGDDVPTVVLVAGLNTSGSTFHGLRDRISGTARTCFYDRAGIGISAPLGDAAPDPSPGSAAADLRATLSAEGIEPPYVMLGWSYGGLVAQAYAADFPEDLVGLVLEDTSVREQFTDRVLIDPGIDWAEGGRDIDLDALVAQLADLDLGDLPVVALSQDTREQWVPAFYRSHDRLARSTSDGVHAIGIGSGHAMHEDVPWLVARTVLEVRSAAVEGTGLPECREVFRGEQVRCRV